MLEFMQQQLEGLDELKEALGTQRAKELIERGRNMSRTQAVRYAFEGTD